MTGITDAAVVAQATVDINELALLGVGTLVVVSILAVVGQLILSYLGQRNLNDIHALGIEAVVAQNQQTNLANELQETNAVRVERSEQVDEQNNNNN